MCNYFLKAKLEKHHPPYSDAIQSPGRGSTWTNLKGDYDIFYFGIQFTILGRLLWILPPVQEQDQSLRHWVSHSRCIWIYVGLHIYIYIHTYIHTYMYAYIYAYIQAAEMKRCWRHQSQPVFRWTPTLFLEVSQEGTKTQKLSVIWQDCPWIPETSENSSWLWEWMEGRVMSPLACCYQHTPNWKCLVQGLLWF